MIGNFAVATTSNVAAAVYVDAVSFAANKNLEGQTPFTQKHPPQSS